MAAQYANVPRDLNRWATLMSGTSIRVIAMTTSRPDREGLDDATPASDDAQRWNRELKQAVRNAATRSGTLRGDGLREAGQQISRARPVGDAPPETTLTAARDGVMDATAKRLKKWHAGQGDSLPFERCQIIVAALRRCPGWEALLRAPSAPLDSDTLAIGVTRLKQFGYTGQAAGVLIAYLVNREGAEC